MGWAFRAFQMITWKEVRGVWPESFPPLQRGGTGGWKGGREIGCTVMTRLRPPPLPPLCKGGGGKLGWPFRAFQMITWKEVRGVWPESFPPLQRGGTGGWEVGLDIGCTDMTRLRPPPLPPLCKGGKLGWPFQAFQMITWKEVREGWPESFPPLQRGGTGGWKGGLDIGCTDMTRLRPPPLPPLCKGGKGIEEQGLGRGPRNRLYRHDKAEATPPTPPLQGGERDRGNRAGRRAAKSAVPT